MTRRVGCGVCSDEGDEGNDCSELINCLLAPCLLHMQKQLCFLQRRIGSVIAPGTAHARYTYTRSDAVWQHVRRVSSIHRFSRIERMLRPTPRSPPPLPLPQTPEPMCYWQFDILSILFLLLGSRVPTPE